MIAFSAVLFGALFMIGLIFSLLMQTQPGLIEYYYRLVQARAYGRANLILIALIVTVFLISAVATYLLSNSLTKPIEQLGKYAQDIGKGDFEVNDFEFRDQELDDLNTALNVSIEQLGRYDADQKTFFQNASHELRTPLMAIQCQAEGIQVGIMDPAEASATILAETSRLSELVTDLLYIARIDAISTAFERQEADLRGLALTSMARQEAIAVGLGLTFASDFDEEPLTASCVIDLVSRALDNLISNAIRYAASRVTVSGFTEGSQAVIRVVDDGPGLTSELLGHVFERFYKGPGGNTGIGLAIVKSIAEQHGGKVTAANSADGGAVFTLSLPLEGT